MYDTLKQIYQRDTSQQKCLLLQDFYNFKYDKIKDMMTNVSHVQNIAFKLRQLNQNVDENMIMTKITILPEDYKRFSTAWDSTATMDRTLDNLVARLMFEEVKCKMTTKEEESIAFKTVTKTKSKSPFKCFSCNQISHAQINCYNKELEPEGAAAKCGALYVGNAILYGNGQDLKQASHEEAVDILQIQFDMHLEVQYIAAEDSDEENSLGEDVYGFS
ncbi:uncharacterized protein LOC111865596 [Cryptotermes secundus]|uniref:uncharacterized protein LOC111865596 n=1 Tax=Cryptotermes secundus TaxID=105785 RepID=UPI000CD7B4CD|nr:uncharacterized protein LOC111865596 [Cryptotermes secundus]XP_023709545.1 uncharacterized protein LOC111865596 [Cryptotermes secundus]